CSTYEAGERRTGTHEPRRELRMGVQANAEGVAPQLNCLYQPRAVAPAAWRVPVYLHACRLELCHVDGVQLVAGAIPHDDDGVFVEQGEVQLFQLGALDDLHGPAAEAHGAAQVLDLELFRHQVDDGVGGVRVELRRVGTCQARDVP